MRGGISASSRCNSRLSASIFSPVTTETGKIGTARRDGSLELPFDAPARLVALRGFDQVDLARNDDDAPHVEKLQNREMLQRLRHHAFACVDDEQQQLHAGGTGKHVMEESLVAGNVDDPALDAVGKLQVRETEVERHAARRSSSQRSGFVPVKAVTSADFP